MVQALGLLLITWRFCTFHVEKSPVAHKVGGLYVERPPNNQALVR